MVVEFKELRVAKATPEDAERGIIRIDGKTMREVNVSQGDVVEIEGRRTTAAIVERAYPSDVGLNLIRMDGLIRKNAGTSIEETVKVRKADVKEAKKIVLAPAQKDIPGQIIIQGLEKMLMGRAIVKGDLIAPIQRRRSQLEEVITLFEQGPFIGGPSGIKFEVTSTDPKGVVIVTDLTEVVISDAAVKGAENIPQITYEDIGGLREEISKVREMLELPLKHPELFQTLGIDPPKGVLLFGPPGTGKTLLAKAVANETNASFTVLNGPEIMSKWYGESEKKLREIFEDAQKKAPAIIFIDEIDAIAPKREEVTGEVERRVVAQLLSLMDGLTARGQVIVIAATNRENSIDPALRRPGRFDREIEIGVPDKKGRKEMLQIHTRRMPLENDVIGIDEKTKETYLDEMANSTYGFVGADIQALVKEAAMAALRRLLPEIKSVDEGQLSKEVLAKLRVKRVDFEEALKLVEPSAMREVMVEIPTTTWEDIGGLDDVKQKLKESVEWPLKKPEIFRRMGIKPPKGILLFGPPGTGKTLLAKAVAHESAANFISVKGPEVFSTFVGEAERRIRGIFKKARQVAPTVIFFDEIDSIAPRRGGSAMDGKVGERVVDQLLTEIDGAEGIEDVLVIGATNRPDIIDPALLRPGRFDRHILIPVPDKAGRKKIFEIHTKSVPLAKDVTLEALAEETEGYVGADIEALCREAAMHALRENMDATEVSKKDFEEATKELNPTMSPEVVKSYEGILKEFKTRSTIKIDEKDTFRRYLG